MKNKILVTGSEGFIGSHLVEELLIQGNQVKAFVLYNSFNSHGWLETLPNKLAKNLEIFFGDVRDSQSVKKALKDCNRIFHLAALIGIPYSYIAPNSYIDTNIIGTLNVLNAARDLDIKKIIHTSTSEVYGSPKFVPITEEHPIQTQSPYSASKASADHLAMAYCSSFDLPISILRPFNNYGPRQSARAIIPTIISQLAGNKNIVKVGALTPTRDFTFVKDTVNGFIKSMNCKKNNGTILNIGSGFDISIKNLIILIGKIMKKKPDIILDKKRIRPKKSEVKQLLSNSKKAKKILNWQPEFKGMRGFEKGLKKTIDWYLSDNNIYKLKSDNYNI